MDYLDFNKFFDYNINFDIGAVFIMIVLVGAYVTGRHLDTYQNKMLLTLFITNLLTAFFDFSNVVLQVLDFPNRIMVMEFSHMMYYITHMSTVIAFYLYCNAFSKSMKKQSVKYKTLIMLPALIDAVIVTINPFIHKLFYFDDDLKYHRGPLVFVFYGSAAFYLIMAAMRIHSADSGIGKLRKFTCYLFLIINALCVIIQYVYPYLLIEAFGASLTLMTIYIAIEHPEEFVDSGYDVLNAKGFECLAENCINTDSGFMMFCIKLQELNGINKAFGRKYVANLFRCIIEYFDEKYPKANLFHYSYSMFIMTVRSSDEEQYAQIKSELAEQFKGIWQVGENNVKIKAVIGCARCPEDIESISAIKDFVYAVKDYTANVNELVIDADKVDIERIRRRRKIKEIVSDASEHGGFEVYYQPIISSKDGSIISAEALIRLNNTELGFVSPEEFIPIAEEQGSIIRIGEFVFRSVCRYIREQNLIEKGLKHIEINLSTVQCLQSNLSESLSKIMSSYDIKPGWINLEITETSEAVFNDTFKDNISSLSELGISFAMDDYGTGYSNMNYLYSMPFSIVKIDKSILWKAFESQRAMIVIENIVTLAHSLGLEIVVEGVENEAHVNKLTELGCEYLQGYYYSKPIPENDFISLVNSGFAS
ncbi:MAG: EAL domain-containing protein [Oscillospiraceae bacterium]|nr:EAL domain-containing protein [Oscillospiraceae bacterium]